MLHSKQSAVIFIVNFLRVISELTASFYSVHILVHWKEQCWLKNDWYRFAQNQCTQKKRVHLSDVGVGWRKRSGMDSILHQMRSLYGLQRVGWQGWMRCQCCVATAYLHPHLLSACSFTQASDSICSTGPPIVQHFMSFHHHCRLLAYLCRQNEWMDGLISGFFPSYISSSSQPLNQELAESQCCFHFTQAECSGNTRWGAQLHPWPFLQSQSSKLSLTQPVSLQCRVSGCVCCLAIQFRGIPCYDHLTWFLCQW